MNRHRIFEAAWHVVHYVFLLSCVLFAYGLVREYSTRQYLKGFSDAVVPATATPEEKVEGILSWMRTGPTRRSDAWAMNPDSRNPQDTLNYGALLQVCGTATNAFVNLANSAGIPARRLLLLDQRHSTKHVVAEALVNGRWIVADPAFRTLLRDDGGHMLTREDLKDPRILAEATRHLKSYSPDYTYDQTTHVRLARIPVVGESMERALDSVNPKWQDSVWMTMMMERLSFARLAGSFFLLGFSFCLRATLRWYGETRLAIRHNALRTQLRHAWRAFFAGES